MGRRQTSSKTFFLSKHFRGYFQGPTIANHFFYSFSHPYMLSCKNETVGTKSHQTGRIIITEVVEPLQSCLAGSPLRVQGPLLLVSVSHMPSVKTEKDCINTKVIDYLFIFSASF